MKPREDFKRILRIASGEAFETEYMLLLAKGLKYIKAENYTELSAKAQEIKMKISNLILQIQHDIETKKSNKALS